MDKLARRCFPCAALILVSAVETSGCADDVDDDFGTGGKTAALAEDYTQDELPALDPLDIVATTTQATPCTQPSDCTTGFCVDGVCCNSACTGLCKACTNLKKRGGSDGICGPIAADFDPDNECVGTCNGIDGCTREPTDLGIGSACAVNGNCISGHCVDGICCDSACTDTCKACNVAGSIGMCTLVGAGQQDSTCNGVNACDYTGNCLGATGQACLSGSECASHICIYGHCLAAQSNPGRLQWLTSMGGYLHQLAAFNNGQGVAVNFWSGVGEWIGSFDADGQHNFGHMIAPSGSGNEHEGSNLARGGIFAWYVLSDHECPNFPIDPFRCYWTCSNGGPSGVSRPVAYLGGQNDVGQFAGISGSWTDSGDYCSPYYAQRNRWTYLQRPSVTGRPGVTIPVPADLQPPVILGPAGEFHWGSGTNLTKTDVNGVVSWTKVPSISGSVQSSEWDVDAAGNILIALSFSGSINYGAGPLVATSAGNLGLVKLDPAGNVLWQKKFATSSCADVKVSRTGTGDFTVSGGLLGMTDFGTGALSGQRVIVKFDSNGNALWHVDVVSAQYPLEVAGDLSGAVYVGANLSASVDLGWGVIENFVAKYE